jgi:hypothetical protein
MKRFILSVCISLIGFAIIKYREPIYRFTGKNAWAEKWLLTGGTLNLYIVIGGLCVIGSVLYLFGVLDTLTVKVFGRFF